MEENKPENNQWRPVQIQTILVPTDLRLESMVAFQYALTLAKLFDANLTLLHVFEESYSFDKEIGLRAVELLGVKKSKRRARTRSHRGAFTRPILKVTKLLQGWNSLRADRAGSRKHRCESNCDVLS